MNKWLFIIITVLTVIVFESCEFEDKYVRICEGKYGSDKVIDSLVRRYGFTNSVYFQQWSKDYLAPEHPNCDTIQLVIQSDTIPLCNDTFAVSVAKVFFNDSMNIHVKYLKIRVVEYALRHTNINFIVSRPDLDKVFVPTQPPDSVEMKYEITDTGYMTFYYSSGTETGMKIRVRLKEDYKNPENLASRIKSNYDPVIKEKKLDEFQVEMAIESPSCTLCADKTYLFYYTEKSKG